MNAQAQNVKMPSSKNIKMPRGKMSKCNYENQNHSENAKIKMPL
jgi:hypothetical protein